MIYFAKSYQTGEAVRTCVLAKRWKNLWTSLPVLEIWFRNSTAKPTMEGITSLLHKIKDVHILEFFPRCHLHTYIYLDHIIFTI